MNGFDQPIGMQVSSCSIRCNLVTRPSPLPPLSRGTCPVMSETENRRLFPLDGYPPRGQILTHKKVRWAVKKGRTEYSMFYSPKAVDEILMLHSVGELTRLTYFSSQADGGHLEWTACVTRSSWTNTDIVLLCQRSALEFPTLHLSYVYTHHVAQARDVPVWPRWKAYIHIYISVLLRSHHFSPVLVSPVNPLFAFWVQEEYTSTKTRPSKMQHSFGAYGFKSVWPRL